MSDKKIEQPTLEELKGMYKSHLESNPEFKLSIFIDNSTPIENLSPDEQWTLVSKSRQAQPESTVSQTQYEWSEVSTQRAAKPTFDEVASLYKKSSPLVSKTRESENDGFNLRCTQNDNRVISVDNSTPSQSLEGLMPYKLSINLNKFKQLFLLQKDLVEKMTLKVAVDPYRISPIFTIYTFNETNAGEELVWEAESLTKVTLTCDLSRFMGGIRPALNDNKSVDLIISYSGKRDAKNEPLLKSKLDITDNNGENKEYSREKRHELSTKILKSFCKSKEDEEKVDRTMSVIDQRHTECVSSIQGAIQDFINSEGMAPRIHELLENLEKCKE